jgi:hypothetical protein
MSDRIAPLGCGTPRLQDEVNEAIDLRPDASASRPHVAAEDEGLHHAHVALEAAEAITLVAELAVHGAAPTIASGAGPFLATGGYIALINHAHAERDRQNLEINDDMAAGAFAALEGHMDDPWVQRMAHDNTAFADGIERVERLSHTRPVEFFALAQAVRASSRGGMLAIARGQEDTASFRERMEVDPAFAHGAGYMQRLRDRDPEAFAAKAAWLEGLAVDVEANRQCQIRA